MKKEKIQDAARSRILILDGAMGTAIQQYGLTEEAFRGEEFRGHSVPLKGGQRHPEPACPGGHPGDSSRLHRRRGGHHHDEHFQFKCHIAGGIPPDGIGVPAEPRRGAHRPRGSRRGGRRAHGVRGGEHGTELLHAVALPGCEPPRVPPGGFRHAGSNLRRAGGGTDRRRRRPAVSGNGIRRAERKGGPCMPSSGCKGGRGRRCR